MKRNNRTCAICSKIYTYCPSCSEFDALPRWMVMFDKKNCLEMFDLVCCYREGQLSKEQALERLEKLSLEDFDKYSEKVQGILNEILEAKSEIISIEEEMIIESTLPKMRKKNRKNKVEQ